MGQVNENTKNLVYEDTKNLISNEENKDSVFVTPKKQLSTLRIYRNSNLKNLSSQ